MSEWHTILLRSEAPDDLLLSALPENWQEYGRWLLNQADIPKSYRNHPFTDAQALDAAKVDISAALGISLGQLIRLLQINRLLRSRAPAAENWQFGQVQTPIGEMLAVFGTRGLCLLEFADRKMLPTELRTLFATQKNYGLTTATAEQLAPLQQQLDEYFAGQRQQFTLALEMIGTDFQQSVWQVLQNIPYGETRSYKAQAEQLGRPSAVRAVANANGQNKISIIIPCHRVIGADGRLTGYGGGLPRKQYLLTLEQQDKRAS
ncbi:methylated-DNA--[protein]-cysteine S-methyltransferase [Suttonella ornithocola]|uniref:Methylated-DNA--protein-cysteine methyltransferase n=1 Tax=Suttonella ornithocola TaxID=279832 RepID=A0A380ML04_9GAMM|nr:methylated-DNA--[protein]-cysteine S-methyltransferase [Suttonella ornithocola]SUO93320.1 Methylated-DNA--protein-cysteine methyltransferase, constitutive [Suttonella ornithocola]